MRRDNMWKHLKSENADYGGWTLNIILSQTFEGNLLTFDLSHYFLQEYMNYIDEWKCTELAYSNWKCELDFFFNYCDEHDDALEKKAYITKNNFPLIFH